MSDAWIKDPRFLMREDMVARLLEGKDCHYHLYFVYLGSNDNPALPTFVEELKKQAEDI